MLGLVHLMQRDWMGGFRVVKPLAEGRGRLGCCNNLIGLDPAAWGGGMLVGQPSGVSDHLLP